MKELRFQTNFGLLRDEGSVKSVFTGKATIKTFLYKIKKRLAYTGDYTHLNISDNVLTLNSLGTIADFLEKNPNIKIHALNLSFNRISIISTEEILFAKKCFDRFGSSIQFIVLVGNSVPTVENLVKTSDYEWMFNKVYILPVDVLQNQGYKGESQQRLDILLRTAQEYEKSRVGYVMFI